MSTEPHTHAHVDVLLTAHDRHDAQAVLDALGAAFEAVSRPRPAGGPAPTTPGRAGEPLAGEQDRPVVWSLCIDTEVHLEGGAAYALHGSVSADLSGGPYYVRGVREVLKEAFRVEERGQVSGDEEVELRLRLTAADRGTASAPR